MARRPGRVATLGEIHQAPGWFWLYCDKCGRSVPMAIAPFVIRWGPDASSDLIRRNARCGACGHRGGSLKHPSWGDSMTGWQPFPVAEG